MNKEKCPNMSNLSEYNQTHSVQPDQKKTHVAWLHHCNHDARPKASNSPGVRSFKPIMSSAQ